MVERVGKTANEISDDPDCTRIKLNGPHTGFIIEWGIGLSWMGYRAIHK
jgi:hypothetical protein